MMILRRLCYSNTLTILHLSSRSLVAEPTITPTKEQVEEFGLSSSLGSPNGAMRKGWNGITISRDTIHIDGVELGFKQPVLFERHAVGGEYGGEREGGEEVGERSGDAFYRGGSATHNFIPRRQRKIRRFAARYRWLRGEGSGKLV